MTLLPAIAIRSLTVLVLGLTLAVGHIAFAAASMKAPQNAAASRAGLADNCYVEAVSTRTAKGKVVTHVVRECD